MTEAKARLGSLFGSNGTGDNTNDPLRYSAPKEPIKAAATAAPAASEAAQNIIYSSTVNLFKYDVSKKSYASCSPSPVGCVILGNNATYSLLLYNAAKEHLSRSPVTVALQATLQPGQYVNFYDASGDNFSARFSTDVDAQTFIRTLFLTKVHVGIWGGNAGAAPTISATALTKEELSSHDANARAIVDGDSVGVALSVWRVVGNIGSSPLDVVTKYAPFEKVSATDVRKFRVGDKAERISALEEGVVGMKKGGTRIVLAPPSKTNGKDWYILQIELVKVKPHNATDQPSSSAAASSRRSKNERLVHQIGLQSQQVNAFETKCDDLQTTVTKLMAEKSQWKEQGHLQLAETANLTAARDAALHQASRLHQEVQQLRYALYQTSQSSSGQDARATELQMERDAALANESAARAIAEQELALVKKQAVNLTSLHASEMQSLRLSHDQEVARLQTAHHDQLEALKAQLVTQVAQQQWKEHAAAVEALQAENALHMERISELEQLQAFHAQARETEVLALKAQVAALEAQVVQDDGLAGKEGSCAHCAEADAKAHQATVDASVKEAAARQALEAADALKKEAQELLLEAPLPSPNVSELFKDVVNDIFYRFQDIFEDEVALDGNQVLKDIKKVLKQSTKEVLAKVVGEGSSSPA
ncbi:hypothetical protein DYB35_007435 [Aphanomyces astaci]|uniref:PPIase FKBP-type domain-containing protein n=1 Tax=Aphanomyces astaci TaxID=112090 RepID=A0A418DNV7_APHAT|nr:hypothetical protein DYB35_007435 [Aphanomyces astaci]